MTCKNCIHFDACADPQGDTKYSGGDLACNNTEELCKFFIDRNAVIKLPCKLGSEVYTIMTCTCNNKAFCGSEYMKKERMMLFKLKNNECLRIFKIKFNIRHLAELGETVFLYPEEAEKRMKELMEI